MDDLHLIDCVEKVRAYCLGQDAGLGPRLEGLRGADFRTQPDAFFKRKLVATALGIDDGTPAGRRLLRQELSRGELAAHFAPEELPDASAESPGSYAAASPGMRERIARSLASFPPYEEAAVSDGAENAVGATAAVRSQRKASFASRLAREPGATAAAGLVARELPALRGRRIYEFLIECGYPAAAPAAEPMRFLYRLGLLSDAAGGGGGGAIQRSYLTAVERLGRLTGSAMGELDLLLGLFSGRAASRQVEAVCTKKPRCGACSVSPYCAYFRYNPPGAQAAGPMPIKAWAADERPRERLLAGERLSNTELLAIILRTGSGGRSALDLGRELLAEFGTLHRLASASPDQIAALRGIGPAKAAEIRAALELGRRVMQPEADDRDGLRAISSSRDVFDLYRPRFKNAVQEEFVLLTMNTKNRVTREVTVSVGTLNSSIVHPRDVFAAALREAAAGVIFVHNHPSGDPAPSKEDRTLTARLSEAGRLLGIKVLDHIIVGSTRYFSFADEGELG